MPAGWAASVNRPSVPGGLVAGVPDPLRREPDVGATGELVGWAKALLQSIYDQPDAEAVQRSSTALSTP